MATNRRRARGHDRIEAAKVARERAARRQRRMPWIVGGAALAVIVVVAIALLATSSSDGPNVTTGTTPGTTTGTGAPGADAAFVYGTADCAPPAPPTPPKIDFSGSNGFQNCVQADGHYTATFDTSAGTIKVDLDATRTPGTTNNFVQLANWGYYDGTKLFRTDPSIGIIQGGSPTTNDGSDPGPGYTIKDEGGSFTYQPGQLVMARTGQPNSAGAQFFFTVDDKASSLDAQGTYVVFGTVTSGLDVLQQILATNVAQASGSGAPNPPVTINHVTVGQASLVPSGG